MIFVFAPLVTLHLFYYFEMGMLKNGKDVTLEDGTIIRSAEVVGASIPGKKICLIWDTYYTEKIAPLCHNADLIVHEATYDNTCMSNAMEHLHSTAEMAGRFAAGKLSF